jgi:hypothetical protein
VLAEPADDVAQPLDATVRAAENVDDLLDHLSRLPDGPVVVAPGDVVVHAWALASLVGHPGTGSVVLVGDPDAIADEWVSPARTARGRVTAAASPDHTIVAGDAVALDLLTDTAGHYLFDLDSANSSSPLFGLRIVESVAAVGADPLLVDTSRIGMLYLGTLRVDADPYTGFKANLTDLRVETNALMHVHDATAAYRIGAAA